MAFEVLQLYGYLICKDTENLPKRLCRNHGNGHGCNQTSPLPLSRLKRAKRLMMTNLDTSSTKMG